MAVAAWLAVARGAVPQTPDEAARIDNWIRQGRLDIAENALQKILAASPAADGAAHRLAALYLKEERFAEAEAVLRRSIAAAPASAEAHAQLGAALLAQGKRQEAQAQYQESLRLAPADPQASLALARTYADNGDFSTALETMEKVPPTKRGADFLPILAKCHLALKQPQAADADMRAILSNAAEHPDFVAEVAEFFLDHGAATDAEALLKAAKQSGDPRLALDEARAQYALGNRDHARAMLSHLMDEYPDNPGPFDEAGRMSAREGDLSRAIYLFERAEKLAPGGAQLLRDLASAQLRAYRPQEALATAERLQAIAPEDPSSSYYLALAYAGLHQDERASGYAERVLAVHPEDREMNLTLANSAIQAHDWAAARKYLGVCLKKRPDDPGALYYLGLVQRDEGDVADAIRSLLKSVAGNPENADAQEQLGSLCAQAGDPACARKALEAAVRLAPHQAHNHYALALAYERLGLKEQAQQQLDLYRKLQAGPPNAPASAQPTPPSPPGS